MHQDTFKVNKPFAIVDNVNIQKIVNGFILSWNGNDNKYYQMFFNDSMSACIKARELLGE